jgi:hypothetical protein
VRQSSSRPEASEIGKTRAITIRGYVTAVNSPTSFEIDQYRVICDEAVTIQVEKPEPNANFTLDDIRVGTELDIKGDFNETTAEIRARIVNVDLDQFRKSQNIAVLSRRPAGIVRSASGWTGTFFADGERIRVSPNTKMSLKLNSEPDDSNGAKAEAVVRPLASIEEITPGMLMTYEGLRDPESGVILADRVEFARNEFEKGEQDLWNRSMVRLKSPDLVAEKPGELTVPGIGRLKIVLNDAVQEYLTQVGESVVPKYALSIPRSNPSRLRFQFYLVADSQPNAFALPTGVFVIHSGLFTILENEAQLAAVIAHEMAHVIQEHQWHDIQDRKTLTTPLGSTVTERFGRLTLQSTEQSPTEAAIRSGYTPAQENQADRVGLEYLVSAGYDPREAPKLWTVIANATGGKSKNYFYDSPDNRIIRRSYLSNEINENYSDLNFKDLRIEEARFKRMSEMAREAIQPVLQGER